MKKDKLKRVLKAGWLAILELYWVYFPLAILGIVLLLLRRQDKIVQLPDMLVVSAIIFGEGMSKIKNVPLPCPIDKEGYFLAGLTGFVGSLILLTLVLFAEHSGVTWLRYLFEGASYWWMLLCLWVFSFLYGIAVRVKIALGSVTGQ